MENLEKFNVKDLDLNEKINFEGGHDDGALLGIVAGVVGMTIVALTGAGALALAGAAIWTGASAYSYK